MKILIQRLTSYFTGDVSLQRSNGMKRETYGEKMNISDVKKIDKLIL